MSASVRSGAAPGVTLVEACVVCAVLAIVAAIAVPSFAGSLERQALEGASAEFEADVQFVRLAAAATERTLLIDFQRSPGGSCYIVHAGAPGDCQCSDTGVPVCRDEAPSLRSVFLPDSGRVRMDSNVAAMRFDGRRHTVSPAGSITFSGASSRHRLREVVNVLGRARACSPDGSMPGLRAC